jgi:hypothetical protein
MAGPSRKETSTSRLFRMRALLDHVAKHGSEFANTLTEG